MQRPQHRVDELRGTPARDLGGELERPPPRRRPASRSSSIRRSSEVSSSGAWSGRTTDIGCGQKVTATSGASGSAAWAVRSSSTCPRWTPSKLPITTTGSVLTAGSVNHVKQTASAIAPSGRANDASHAKLSGHTQHLISRGETVRRFFRAAIGEPCRLRSWFSERNSTCKRLRRAQAALSDSPGVDLTFGPSRPIGEPEVQSDTAIVDAATGRLSESMTETTRLAAGFKHSWSTKIKTSRCGSRHSALTCMSELAQLRLMTLLRIRPAGIIGTTRRDPSMRRMQVWFDVSSKRSPASQPPDTTFGPVLGLSMMTGNMSIVIHARPHRMPTAWLGSSGRVSGVVTSWVQLE